MSLNVCNSTWRISSVEGQISLKNTSLPSLPVPMGSFSKSMSTCIMNKNAHETSQLIWISVNIKLKQHVQINTYSSSKSICHHKWGRCQIICPSQGMYPAFKIPIARKYSWSNNICRQNMLFERSLVKLHALTKSIGTWKATRYHSLQWQLPLLHLALPSCQCMLCNRNQLDWSLGCLRTYLIHWKMTRTYRNISDPVRFIYIYIYIHTHTHTYTYYVS